ncbi:MAG: tyrosine-type recombinase/integrase, partial [Rhodospirillaceae bacterium]|nr:tyrosine-type recombinase/integrase [Rhodospirillaceae bacterium]
GHPVQRLPDDLVERVRRAAELNDSVDHGPVIRPGSVGWVVKVYRDSDDFARLAKGTLKYYARFLADIEKLGQALAFSSFTRKAVIRFVDSYAPSMRRSAGAVLRNLFNVAIYHGYATENYASNLRTRSPGRRDQLFTEADAAAWLAAADELADELSRRAFILLRYTVQRPCDALRMAYTNYDGDVIRLRQQKTKKLVDVPCHAALRAEIDRWRADRPDVLMCSKGGRALRYWMFSARFRVIADRAGLKHLQARDLRRSAAVLMAEAGATVPQIAAVAGWSIERTSQILEHYIPRTTEMARQAVRIWERKSNVDPNAQSNVSAKS